MNRIVVAGVVGLSVIVSACGGSEAVSRDEVVAVVADDGATVIAGFPATAAAATAAATAACAPTPASVQDTRAAIEAARTAWHEAEGYWFGPVADRRSPGFVDWPVNQGDVDELLAAAEPATIDAAYLRDFVGADTRGYSVGLALLNAAPLSTRACDYLLAVTTVAEEEIAAVADAWDDEVDALNADPDDALDMVVNQLLMLSSSRDRIDIVARSRAIEGLIFGPDGSSGIAPLLDDDLADRLRAEVDTLIAAADATDAVEVADDPDLTDALDAVRATVGTEVVSVLGVTVTFSDADGDSAG